RHLPNSIWFSKNRGQTRPAVQSFFLVRVRGVADSWPQPVQSTKSSPEQVGTAAVDVEVAVVRQRRGAQREDFFKKNEKKKKTTGSVVSARRQYFEKCCETTRILRISKNFLLNRNFQSLHGRPCRKICRF